VLPEQPIHGTTAQHEGTKGRVNMAPALQVVESSTATATSGSTASPDDGSPFTLDVKVFEQGDLGGLVRLTDDGCGSTCGACTTG
jgi:FxLD family lantipeptide